MSQIKFTEAICSSCYQTTLPIKVFFFILQACTTQMAWQFFLYAGDICLLLVYNLKKRKHTPSHLHTHAHIHLYSYTHRSLHTWYASFTLPNLFYRHLLYIFVQDGIIFHYLLEMINTFFFIAEILKLSSSSFNFYFSYWLRLDGLTGAGQLDTIPNVNHYK